MIFDDYDWKETKVGIDRVINEYKSMIHIIDTLTGDGISFHQIIVQKL